MLYVFNAAFAHLITHSINPLSAMNKLKLCNSLILIALSCVLPNPVLLAETPTTKVIVTKVVDGDTFWGQDANKIDYKIRLIGIDAPESRKTGNKPIGYYGKEASDYLKNLLNGKTVKLEYDKGKTDRYGRVLAYVYLADGTFVNNLLAKEGYANAIYYKPNGKYTQLLSKSCEEAKKLKKGMWNK